MFLSPCMRVNHVFDLSCFRWNGPLHNTGAKWLVWEWPSMAFSTHRRMIRKCFMQLMSGPSTACVAAVMRLVTRSCPRQFQEHLGCQAQQSLRCHLHQLVSPFEWFDWVRLQLQPWSTCAFVQPHRFTFFQRYFWAVEHHSRCLRDYLAAVNISLHPKWFSFPFVVQLFLQLPSLQPKIPPKTPLPSLKFPHPSRVSNTALEC